MPVELTWMHVQSAGTMITSYKFYKHSTMVSRYHINKNLNWTNAQMDGQTETENLK